MLMEMSGSEHSSHPAVGHDSAEERDAESEVVEISTRTGADTLEELIERLERAPEECRRACEGLESLDVDTRLSIIERLAGIQVGPGVVSLLGLLAASENTETREAARAVEKILEGRGVRGSCVSPMGDEVRNDPVSEPARGGFDLALRSSPRLGMAEDQDRPRLVNCLVTAVDGMGRGSVAISSSRHAERTSVIFLLDVERGITDAMGQVEEESLAAGAILEEAKVKAGARGIEGVPELALPLLAGCLSLSGPDTTSPVLEWLERALGRGFEPRPLPFISTNESLQQADSFELLQRASEVLRACPTWLDRSPLTFELAEELCLREGRVAVDPHRDQGAFRFLFEHRISHRLELYRRMLIWMHRFWSCAAEPELALSAQILAWQLTDEQFAVPSHPFIVTLTALSLDAAREKLGAEDDPRSST